MKALVTGGAGFIGSTLVDRLLAEDWRVDVVDDLSTGALGNLADARRRRRPPVLVPPPRRPLAGAARRSSRTAEPDVVFHLAAQIDVRVSVAQPGARRRGEHPRLAQRAARARSTPACRKVVFAASGGTIYGIARRDPDARRPRRSGRSRRTASRRRPSATTSTTTGESHGLEYDRARARQRVRPAPGPARRGRRRRDLRGQAARTASAR